MCLATSNNLLLVLQDAPKRIFSTKSRSSGQRPKNDAKALFSHPPSPFPGNFCNCSSPLAVLLQQSLGCYLQRYLYCFAMLGSTSIVTHSVKQRLLRNRPGSALRPLATSRAKDYKAHSLQQTSFAESPNSAVLPVGRSALQPEILQCSVSGWTECLTQYQQCSVSG